MYNPEFLIRNADAQLDDIERELGVKPSPSAYELFEGRFNAIERSLEEAAACTLGPDLERRLAQAKSHLEEASLIFANYVNEPEPFDPWDKGDE